jgi:hypothetical protein
MDRVTGVIPPLRLPGAIVGENMLQVSFAASGARNLPLIPFCSFT